MPTYVAKKAISGKNASISRNFSLVSGVVEITGIIIREFPLTHFLQKFRESNGSILNKLLKS